MKVKCKFFAKNVYINTFNGVTMLKYHIFHPEKYPKNYPIGKMLIASIRDVVGLIQE